MYINITEIFLVEVKGSMYILLHNAQLEKFCNDYYLIEVI